MDQEDFGAQSYRPLNRGSKLLNRGLEPSFVSSKPSLMSMHSIDEMTKFDTINKKRAIVRKGAPWRLEDPEEGGPYSEIHIEELWGGLDKVDDVRRNKSAVRTLRSRQLKILAGQAMDMIEEESKLHRLLGRLLDTIIMDNPFSEEQAISKGVPDHVMQEFRQVVQQCVCTSSETLRQLSGARSKIVTAYNKKKTLAKKLVPFTKPNDSKKRG
ncbi:hypothetical protein HDU97_002850 [Phlyctochytrium planicorne]|nr:hypothetical protein HDU97_002850 [Phlyctochytrium planicorne]